jgi:hypothetical protein
MIFWLKGVRILRPSSGKDCDGDSLLAGYQHHLGPSEHHWNATDSLSATTIYGSPRTPKQQTLPSLPTTSENFDA